MLFATLLLGAYLFIGIVVFAWCGYCAPWTQLWLGFQLIAFLAACLLAWPAVVAFAFTRRRSTPDEHLDKAIIAVAAITACMAVLYLVLNYVIGPAAKR
jgi:membrane protein implicated in regulation of membrane protease activity